MSHSNRSNTSSSHDKFFRRILGSRCRRALAVVALCALTVASFDVTVANAATPTVGLGTASPFAVPAHSSVTARTAASASLPATQRSRPLTLAIPAIGVRTSVGTLGLQPDDQVMVPTTIHTVGWYVDGPAPGQEGSAVILGHVDSYQGVGIFFNLKLLKAGDKIQVVSQDGVTTDFVVSRVVEYSKTAFPDRLVYGPHGTRSLQLVTCGGVFDQATGHYESNIVVFSQLVGVTPAKTVTSS